MTGIDALPRLRELVPAVPVLLITAYADLRQAVAALKSGASDYLSKPLDLDELKVAIEDALSTSFGASVSGYEAAPPLPAGFSTIWPSFVVCRSISRMEKVYRNVCSNVSMQFSG